MSIVQDICIAESSIFDIFGGIKILQFFRYNHIIFLEIIGFCCIEGEIGVSSDLSKIVTKRRFLFNN